MATDFLTFLAQLAGAPKNLDLFNVPVAPDNPMAKVFGATPGLPPAGPGAPAAIPQMLRGLSPTIAKPSMQPPSPAMLPGIMPVISALGGQAPAEPAPAGGDMAARVWNANPLSAVLGSLFPKASTGGETPKPAGNPNLLSGTINLPGRAEDGTRTITIPGAGTGIKAKPLSFEEALVGSESGGRKSVVNKEGYAGLYQFGAPRLADLGIYTPRDGSNWQKWDGEFSIPGYPEVRTKDDFLKSPEAQRTAFGLHKDDILQQLSATGYDKYIGQTVGGVPITKEAILGMAHLGGLAGAKKFLDSGGKYNPADSNGTKLSDYGKKFSGTEDTGEGGFPTLTPYTAPTLPGVTPATPLASVDPSKMMEAYAAAAPRMTPAGPTDRLMNVLAGMAQGAAKSGSGGGLTFADVLAAAGGGAAGGAAGDTAAQQQRIDRHMAATQGYKMAGVGLQGQVAQIEAENKNNAIRAGNTTAERTDQRALQQAQVNASAAERNTEQGNSIALKKWELGVPKTQVTTNGIVVQKMDPNTGATTVTVQDFNTLDSQIAQAKKIADVLGKDDPNAKVLRYQTAAKLGGTAAVYREFVKDLVEQGQEKEFLGDKKFQELNTRAMGAIPSTVTDSKNRDTMAKQHRINELQQAILPDPALVTSLVTHLAKKGNPFATQMLQAK